MREQNANDRITEGKHHHEERVASGVVIYPLDTIHKREPSDFAGTSKSILGCLGSYT